MSRVRPGVSDKSAPCVRDLLWSARSHLRLCADSRVDFALDNREAAAQPVALSRIAAGRFRGRARNRPALGLQHLYIKDDTVNHPTLSYKDRVVSVSIAKAREFGFTTVSCASTGNLAT